MNEGLHYWWRPTAYADEGGQPVELSRPLLKQELEASGKPRACLATTMTKCPRIAKTW